MRVIDHCESAIRKGNALPQVMGDDMLAAGDEIDISPGGIEAGAATEIEIRFHERKAKILSCISIPRCTWRSMNGCGDVTGGWMCSRKPAPARILVIVCK